MLWIQIMNLILEASCQTLIVRDNITGCTLATPTITYTSRENYIELPGDITGEIRQSDKVRVGYMMNLGVFQYTGCAPMTNMPERTPQHTIQADPGQCYSLCGSKYFALSYKQCFCLAEILTDTSGKCDEGCSYPRNTACGGEDSSSTCVSVYEFVEILNRTFDDGRFCYAHEAQSQTYKWRQCGQKLDGFCQNKGGLVFRSGHTVNWKDYTVKCFGRDGCPVDASISEAKNLSSREPTMWVGRIKSFVIRNTSEPFFPNHRGFIRWDDVSNRYVLKFDSKISLAGCKFLCSSVKYTVEDTTDQNTNKNEPASAHHTSWQVAVTVIGMIVVVGTIFIIILILYRKKRLKQLLICRKRDKNRRPKRNDEGIEETQAL